MRDLSTWRSVLFGADSHSNIGPLKLDSSWGIDFLSDSWIGIILCLTDQNDDTIDTLKERIRRFMLSIFSKLCEST